MRILAQRVGKKPVLQNFGKGLLQVIPQNSAHGFELTKGGKIQILPKFGIQSLLEGFALVVGDAVIQNEAVLILNVVRFETDYLGNSSTDFLRFFGVQIAHSKG